MESDHKENTQSHMYIGVTVQSLNSSMNPSL